MSEKKPYLVTGRMPPVADWEALTPQCITALNEEGLTWPQLSARTGIAIPTLQSQAKRHMWPVKFNHKRIKKEAEAEAKKAVITDWVARGESVREAAFKLAFNELKAKKKLSIRNWRDAETADKMARRAAGLENETAVNLSLVSINEAINAHGQDNEVLEAEVIEPPALAEQADSLEDSAPPTSDSELVEVEQDAPDQAVAPAP